MSIIALSHYQNYQSFVFVDGKFGDVLREITVYLSLAYCLVKVTVNGYITKVSNSIDYNYKRFG